MPASDYVVLRDTNIDIEGPNHGIDLNARIPPPSQFDRTASPILWFNLQPLTSQRLKFIVVLNDPAFHPDHIDENKLVLTYDSGDDIRLLRSIHEVLPVSLFIPGDNNIFRFQVVTGSARFSDIVLLFHVNAL